MSSAPRTPPQGAVGARSRRGQALVEFAIVAPTMLLVLFGVFEGSLLVFSNGSAHYAAGEAARILTQEGSEPTADTDAVGYVRQNTALGTTGIAQVSEIDVYKVIRHPGTGQLERDPAQRPNRYQLDGSLIGSLKWDPVSRNSSANAGDYVGVDILYTYTWKSGYFTAFFGPGVTSQSTVWARIEPTVY